MGFKMVTASRFPHDTPTYRQKSEAQKAADNFTMIAAGLGKNVAPTAAITTVGAGTYLAADLLGGYIVRDPNGASRTDTLDSAANIVAALVTAGANPKVGDIIRVKILNNADAAETITLAVPASGSFGAAQKTHANLAVNTSLVIDIRLTNVSSGAEAYVVYD